MATQNLIIPDEIWKDIPGYPHYQASTMGRIRSLMNLRHGTIRLIPKVLRPGWNGSAMYVILCNPGRRTFSVARLVLATFVGPCPEGMECCHKSDDGRDNSLQNLRWGTRLSNVQDKFRNNRVPLGTQCSNVKLTEGQVKEIRHLHSSGLKPTAIAKKFGVCRDTIYDIAARKSWAHLP